MKKASNRSDARGQRNAIVPSCLGSWLCFLLLLLVGNGRIGAAQDGKPEADRSGRVGVLQRGPNTAATATSDSLVLDRYLLTRMKLCIIGNMAYTGLNVLGLAAGLALSLFSDQTAVPATVTTIFMLVYMIWLSIRRRS